MGEGRVSLRSASEAEIEWNDLMLRAWVEGACLKFIDWPPCLGRVGCSSIGSMVIVDDPARLRPMVVLESSLMRVHYVSKLGDDEK